MLAKVGFWENRTFELPGGNGRFVPNVGRSAGRGYSMNERQVSGTSFRPPNVRDVGDASLDIHAPVLNLRTNIPARDTGLARLRVGTVPCCSSGDMDAYGDLLAEPILKQRTLTRGEMFSLQGTPHAVLECNFAEADLSGLDLSQWSFEKCDLRRADFHGTKLERTTWRSWRAAFASFVGCDFSETLFANSDFNNVYLKRSNLDGAKIVGCKLTGADLTDVRALEIRFEESLLINAKLPGRDFRKATLTRVDFSQADLSKCDFRYTTFVNSSLREAILDHARFEGADLRGADLGGVRLGDASQFRGATISPAQASQLLSEVGLKVR